jgi:lactoylglutathione lyase
MDIERVDHIGIRVEDEARALAFYERLGFTLISRSDSAKVAIVRNAAGVEINFILNASTDNGGRNVLMDEDERFAGYTHVALRVPSADAAAKELEAMGVTITEGPIALGQHNISLFFRDPDRNVIELTEVSGK